MHQWLPCGAFYAAGSLGPAKTSGATSDQIPALTDAKAHVSLAPMMRAIFKSLLLLLPLFLVSCATTSITNLTPTSYPRNPTGQYMVEMEINTTQTTFLPSSVTPMVVVGFENYPMRPTKRTQHRWEGLVPIPANKDSISYHFKVDYEYQKFGKTGKGSLLSHEYGLRIK
jgi:hypothetical protein